MSGHASVLRVDSSAFFVQTELEIVEFVPPYRLVSKSTVGIRSLTTWALASVEAGTRVTFTGDYHLPLALRLLGDRALEQHVAVQVRRSLANLKQLVEADAPEAGRC